MATKEAREPKTIAEKVQAEREERGVSPDSPVAPAIEKSHSTDDPEGMTVGSIFRFSFHEIARIKVATEEYDKQAHSARRTMVSLNVSPMPIDVVRSRCAEITTLMETADDETDVTLNHPLRVTLGDALSLHLRKIARLESKALPGILCDTNDIVKAEEATRHIANKIGEQLTMHLESEDEE